MARRTPLHRACQAGSMGIVQTLLSLLVNTDITDNDQNTPIDSAQLLGNNEVKSCFSLLASVDTVSSVVNKTEITDVSSVVSDVTISCAQPAKVRNGYGKGYEQRFSNISKPQLQRRIV